VRTSSSPCSGCYECLHPAVGSRSPPDGSGVYGRWTGGGAPAGFWGGVCSGAGRPGYLVGGLLLWKVTLSLHMVLNTWLETFWGVPADRCRPRSSPSSSGGAC